MKLLTTADDVFTAMCMIVEAENYPLLKHYKKDLYELDKRFLSQIWHPFARAIWVVRESGTHLCLVGIHERSADSALAAIDAAGSTGEIYSLSIQGLKRITRAEAITLSKSIDYKMESGNVTCKGESIASYVITMSQSNCRPIISVDFLSSKLDVKCHGTRVMLEALTGFEGIKKSQSLFVGIGSITLNQQCFKAEEALTSELATNNV